MNKLITKFALAVLTVLLLGTGSILAENVLESASLKLNCPTLVTGMAGDDIETGATLTNKTSSNLSVKYGCEIISKTEGQEPQFCYGLCRTVSGTYWPADSLWTNGSFSPSHMTPNYSTVNNEIVFHVLTYDYISEKSLPGITKIRFFFYNAADRNDSVSIEITFDAMKTGVNDDGSAAADFDLLGMSPNPANNNTTVHFNLPENNYDVPYLEVWDSRGSRVLREDICDCAHDKNIDVSKLPTGSYYMNIICDGKKTKSKPFAITR